MTKIYFVTFFSVLLQIALIPSTLNNEFSLDYNLQFSDTSYLGEQTDDELLAYNEAYISLHNELKSVYEFQYDESKSNIELIREQMPNYVLALQTLKDTDIEQRIVDLYLEMMTLNDKYNCYEAYYGERINVSFSAKVDLLYVHSMDLLACAEIFQPGFSSEYFIENPTLYEAKMLSTVSLEKDLTILMYSLYFEE